MCASRLLKNDLFAPASSSAAGFAVQSPPHPLPAQMCSTCVASFYWGSQTDAALLDFYDGKFFGFALANVSKPDGSLELDHKPNLSPGRVKVVLRQESEPTPPDKWRRCIVETAGKWQGEFERPEQGEYE